MKKLILSCLIIVTLTITSGCGSKADETQNTMNTPTPTNEAGNEATKTPTQEPTPIKEITDNHSTDENTLYPAYQMINGEQKYGYIDSTGNFVIEPTYTSASDYSDNRAIVWDVNTGKSMVLDLKGNIIYENDYTITPFKNGTAVVSVSNGDTLSYGYIDVDGNMIIEPKYLRADSFNKEGKAFVSTDNHTYAIIDKDGNILESYELDAKYESVYSFEDGYIIYSDPDVYKIGVVNYKGETIMDPLYDDINYLGNNLFAAPEPSEEIYESDINKPYAIFNNQGKKLTDYSFNDLSSFTNGLASATDSKSTFFIDEQGNKKTDLPMPEGRGSLKMIGDIIKAEIDRDLIYMTKDNTVIWQNNRTHELTTDIVVNEVKIKPNKFVAIYYPVIDGLKDNTVQKKINDQLYTLFTKDRLDLTEENALSVEDSFEVELINNLLIIQKNGYDYPFGAAHGMPIKDCYHINITTGDRYELKDLFIEGSEYTGIINDFIHNKISEDQDSMYFDDAFTGITETTHFTITNDSLIIYFNPYDIAPYAAGFPEFKIPFDELSDYINKDGAFWQAIQ